MVLESLSNAYDAEMHPAKLILHGAIYSVVAILLSLWTFPQYASIVMVFFISLACMPVLYAIIKYEEDKDYHAKKEWFLIKEHSRAILAYLALFLGITLTLALAFFVLPESTIHTLFEAQIYTYGSINPHQDVSAQITGQVTSSLSYFNKIFLNNMRVLVLAILFSFVYGAGAIFIMTWNASVLALAIGYTIRSKLGLLAAHEGLQQVGNWLGVGAHTIILRYGIHGFLEISAYMTAGLAGGIISVAAIRHHYSTKAFEHIVVDSADLILIAIALLLVGAGWEAWITPVLSI
jgi:uncharacterized membrane protein SpoIIM required for sporulation